MSLQVPVLPPLPPVIGKDDQKDVLEVNKPKIVIIYSKDIDDQIQLIQQYGKVVKFNNSLINVDLNKIDCDYLLCDASDKICLENVERHYDDNNIQFCHYGYFFERDFYEEINAITKFKFCKDKNDFDKSLLTQKKLARPSKILNCLSFLVSFLGSLKK